MCLWDAETCHKCNLAGVNRFEKTSRGSALQSEMWCFRNIIHTTIFIYIKLTICLCDSRKSELFFGQCYFKIKSNPHLLTGKNFLHIVNVTSPENTVKKQVLTR